MKCVHRNVNSSWHYVLKKVFFPLHLPVSKLSSQLMQRKFQTCCQYIPNSSSNSSGWFTICWRRKWYNRWTGRVMVSKPWKVVEVATAASARFCNHCPMCYVWVFLPSPQRFFSYVRVASFQGQEGTCFL